MMDRKELASRLDVTIARPDAQSADVQKAAADAMRFAAACLFAPPVWTSRLAAVLRGSGVRLGALVAFPHGGSKSTIKAIEASSAVKDGAERIEIVPHLANLLSLDVDSARHELMEITRSARAAQREVNLAAIVDVHLLWNRRGERAVELACRAVREGGFDGIVIPAAGDSHAMGLVKTHGQSLTIKVSGVESASTARTMLESGVALVGIDVEQLCAIVRVETSA
jgi:deoxyribose-phosphate aldolase